MRYPNHITKQQYQLDVGYHFDPPGLSRLFRYGESLSGCQILILLLGLHDTIPASIKFDGYVDWSEVLNGSQKIHSKPLQKILGFCLDTSNGQISITDPC